MKLDKKMTYIRDWVPSNPRYSTACDSSLEDFKQIVQKKYNLSFESYWDFHEWSVNNRSLLWAELWHYLGIIASKPFAKVFTKMGDSFLDVEWFRGARLNFAENLMKYRDDGVALIYSDENGGEEIVTFAQLYEKVRQYAAAFRANGLKVGDIVASYISNRTEAIYAMLAACSIGAIFGGVHPHNPAESSVTTMNVMDPKFLVAVDFHQFDGKGYNTIDTLKKIADKSASVKKIIIIPTLPSTTPDSISQIHNGVLLDEFLNSGVTSDGDVPELYFEQLPASHPVGISFTSGTTGVPKGFLHSSSSLLSLFKDYTLHWNLKKGDIVLNETPSGCSMWNYILPVIGRGIGVLLYQGSATSTRNGMNYWDVMAHYGVSLVISTPTNMLWLEDNHILPSPGTNLDRLKAVFLTSTTPYQEHFDFLEKKIKSDMFIGNVYGSTETLGDLSGFDVNMPYHPPEVQVQGLGMKVACLDSKGRPVIGERGEMVLTTQYPAQPIGILKDENRKKISELNLNKYPGFWSMNDVGFINPKTKGIIILGRSDNTLKPYIGMDIGTDDVYFAIHHIREIKDCICVPQRLRTGRSRLVLFVKIRNGYKLNENLKQKISQTVTEKLRPECVPEVMHQVSDIPYNLNHKRLERVVRQIVETNKIPDVKNIENPECLPYFLNIPEIMNHD